MGYVAENHFLLLSTVVTLISILSVIFLMRKKAKKETAFYYIPQTAPKDVKGIINIIWPGGKTFRKITNLLITALFYCSFVFYIFKKTENIAVSVTLACLCAVLSIITLYVSFIVLMKAVNAFLKLKDRRGVLIYTFCLFNIIIMFINLLFGNKSIDTISFCLIMFNLSADYIIISTGLFYISKIALTNNVGFNVKRVWKLAFMEILFYLVILSLMSYAVYLCFDNSYLTLNGDYGIFTAFYYTVITFATVGYGDITPVSDLSRAVSILTCLTSILCLTIMLSAVMSISRNSNQKETKK